MPGSYSVRSEYEMNERPQGFLALFLTICMAIGFFCIVYFLFVILFWVIEGESISALPLNQSLSVFIKPYGN